MTFVNEYLSPDDIAKLRLKEQFLKSNPSLKEVPASFKPHWIIDRDRNIYVMGAGSSHQAYDAENWKRFLLDWNGQQYFLVIEPGRGSMTLSERPYIVVWDKLLSIYPPDLHGRDKKDVVDVIKEALTARGYSGPYKQIPNTIVKFNF